MTVKEFFSEENIAKSNPFEGLEVKQKITMDEYKEISDLVVSLMFNDKDEYMPLTKDFSFKFWVMVYYLNLDASEMPETSKAFTIINCTNIFDEFVSKLDYPSQISNIKSSIDNFVDYCVSNNIILNQLLIRAKDIITTLSSDGTIENLIKMIGTEIIIRDTPRGDDVINGKT